MDTPEIAPLTEKKIETKEQRLELQVRRLLEEAYICTKRVDINIDGSKLRIAGQVANQAQRDMIDGLVAELASPYAIENAVVVESPPPPSVVRKAPVIG